ncbi:MAG: XrtA/PEP-CTERM system histidine kinase PrsK [Nitrospirales bacterium]
MVWTIPCFLSGGAALVLAAFIIFRQKQGRVFFALFSVLTVTALIQFSIGLTILNERQLLLWRQVSLIGEIVLPVTLYLVAFSFMRHLSLPIQQVYLWRYRTLLVLAIGIGTLVMTFPHVVMTLVVDEGVLVFERPWGRMIWGFILVGLVMALSEFEHILRTSRDPLRYQIKFVVIGLGAIAGMGIVHASQMLLFSTWQREYIWISAIVVLMSTGLIMYGLSRWEEEDLSRKLYVSPQVLYTSLTFLIVGVYLIGVGVFAEIVRQTDWAMNSALGMLLLFVACLALVIALFSRQARAELQAFIAKHFYRSKYDYRSKWLELTESFSSCQSLDAILDEFLNILSRTFGAPKVTIWMKFQTDSRFHQVRSLTTGPLSNSIADTHPVVIELVNQTGPIILQVAETEQNEEVETFMEGTRAVVCVPLQSVSEDLMGFVTLSEELHSRKYVRDDFDLLRAMAHHVAMLLNQVKLMDEQRVTAEWEAVHRFSAFYLHDLKNLASGLSLVSQNAEMYGHDPEFQVSAMRTIGNTVQRIMALIGKLSIQVHSPKQEVAHSFELMNVNTSVSEAVEALHGTHCTPKFSPGVDLPQVSIIPEEFKHVVLNLLLNAQQALNGEGTIKVETKREGTNVSVTIRDDGPGIPESQLRTLFQPFRTTKKTGLGIGLYQCKQIVKNHGGAMRIESQEGRGTHVHILLPEVSRN